MSNFFNFFILLTLSSSLIFSPSHIDLEEPNPKRQRQEESLSFAQSSQGLSCSSSGEQDSSNAKSIYYTDLSYNSVYWLTKLCTFLRTEDNGTFFKFFFEYELASHPQLISDQFYLEKLLSNVFDRGISFDENQAKCYELINLIENIIHNYNESHLKKYIEESSLIITFLVCDQNTKLNYYQALLCNHEFPPHKPLMIRTNYKCSLELKTEEEHRLILSNRLKNDFKKLINLYDSVFNPLR